jgi:hypothetical protein
MKKIVFTDHALIQMLRRGISKKEVREIIQNPGQTDEIRPGRVLMQSRIIERDRESEILIRVFADVSEKSIEVVTAYRTSRIEKYWRL